MISSKDTPPVQRALARRMLPSCHPGGEEYESTKALFEQAGITSSFHVQAVASMSLEDWTEQVGRSNGVPATLAALLHVLCKEYTNEMLGVSLVGKSQPKREETGRKRAQVARRKSEDSSIRSGSQDSSSNSKPCILIVDSETGEVNWQKVDGHTEISQAALGRHQRQNLKWEGRLHDQYFVCMVVKQNGVLVPTCLYEIVFKDFAAELRSWYSTDAKFKALIEKWPAAAGALEGAPESEWIQFKNSVRTVIQNWIHNHRKSKAALEATERSKSEFEADQAKDPGVKPNRTDAYVKSLTGNSAAAQQTSLPSETDKRPASQVPILPQPAEASQGKPRSGNVPNQTSQETTDVVNLVGSPTAGSLSKPSRSDTDLVYVSQEASKAQSQGTADVQVVNQDTDANFAAAAKGANTASGVNTTTTSDQPMDSVPPNMLHKLGCSPAEGSSGSEKTESTNDEDKSSTEDDAKSSSSSDEGQPANEPGQQVNTSGPIETSTRPKRDRPLSRKAIEKLQIEALQQQLREAQEALKKSKKEEQIANTKKKDTASKRASKAQKEEEHRKKLKKR